MSHSKHLKLFLKKVKWITLKHEEYEKKIWIPDTFMRNDVKGKRLETIQPDNYIRIFPDGKYPKGAETIFCKQKAVLLYSPRCKS